MDIKYNIFSSEEMFRWIVSRSNEEMIQISESIDLVKGHGGTCSFFTPIVEFEGKLSFTLFRYLPDNKSYVIRYECPLRDRNYLIGVMGGIN
jgi:hypothetical protein